MQGLGMIGTVMAIHKIRDFEAVMQVSRLELSLIFWFL